MDVVAQSQFEAAFSRISADPCFLEHGFIKFIDAAKIIIDMWGESSDMNPQAMRPKIVKFVENVIQQVPGQHVKHDDGVSFRWKLMPQIVMAFCQEHLPVCRLEQCIRALIDNAATSRQSGFAPFCIKSIGCKCITCGA